MRLRTEAGRNSFRLISLQFGDLVSVPGRQVGSTSLTVPWHLLPTSKYTWAKLSLGKVVHELLESLKRSKICVHKYINSYISDAQTSKPEQLLGQVKILAQLSTARRALSQNFLPFHPSPKYQNSFLKFLSSQQLLTHNILKKTLWQALKAVCSSI